MATTLGMREAHRQPSRTCAVSAELRVHKWAMRYADISNKQQQQQQQHRNVAKPVMVVLFIGQGKDRHCLETYCNQ